MQGDKVAPFLVKSMRPNVGDPSKGEISFKKDVELVVFERSKDGDLFKGEIVSTGESGWFLAFNVKKVPGGKAPEIKSLKGASSASPQTAKALPATPMPAVTQKSSPAPAPAHTPSAAVPPKPTSMLTSSPAPVKPSSSLGVAAPADPRAKSPHRHHGDAGTGSSPDKDKEKKEKKDKKDKEKKEKKDKGDKKEKKDKKDKDNKAKNAPAVPPKPVAPPKPDISMADLKGSLQQTLRRNTTAAVNIPPPDAFMATQPSVAPTAKPQATVSAAPVLPVKPTPVVAVSTASPANSPTVHSKPAGAKVTPERTAAQQEAARAARAALLGGPGAKPSALTSSNPFDDRIGLMSRAVPKGKAAAMDAGVTKRAEWMNVTTLRAPRAKAGAPGAPAPAPVKAQDMAALQASMEANLASKWKEFELTLPKVERKGRSYKEALDAKEVQKLETDANTIVRALLNKSSGATMRFAKPPPELTGPPAMTIMEETVETETTTTTNSTTNLAIGKPAAPSVEVTVTTTSTVTTSLAVRPPPPKPPPMKSAPITRVSMLPTNDLEQVWSVRAEKLLKAGGIHRWRIENLLPVKNYDEPHIYCSHDCYIVLLVPDPSVKDGTSHNLHFWIGKKATLDKVTSCAIRATQLNSYLGSICKHIREGEGDESPLFKSYFDDLVRTDKGATECAFRIVEKKQWPPRLYVVRDHPGGQRCLELIERKPAALFQEGVFLLDCVDRLFVWAGTSASTASRFWLLEMANALLRDERACKGSVQELYSNETGKSTDVFYELLGGRPAPASVPTKDPAPSKQAAVLYKVHQGESAIGCDKVWEGEGLLKKETLTGEHAYILDATSELFLWIGKKTPAKLRKVAEALMENFRGDGRGEWASTSHNLEGVESLLFRGRFFKWLAMGRSGKVDPEELARAKARAKAADGGANAHLLSKDDVLQLLDPQSASSEGELRHDNSGTTQCWLLTRGGSGQTAVPADEKGHFYSHECYLVLHVYEAAGKQQSVLYFWQGKDASNRVWPMFQLSLAQQLEDKFVKSGYTPPSRVRIMQQKEPREFLSLFDDCVVVHRGSRAQEIKRKDRVALYHLRAYGGHRVMAVEVTRAAASLQSRDAFVLTTPTQLFIWRGASIGSSLANAQLLQVSTMLQGTRVPEVCEERDELPAFWSAIGGKQAYVCDTAFWQKYSKPARLYRLGNLFGEQSAHELQQYVQGDLNGAEMDAFLLDTQVAELFLWLPHQASDKMLAAAERIAALFLSAAQTGRPGMALKLERVTERAEPVAFGAFFHGWKALEAFVDPYAEREAKLKVMMAEEAAKQAKETAEKEKTEATQRAADLKAREENKAKLAAASGNPAAPTPTPVAASTPAVNKQTEEEQARKKEAEEAEAARQKREADERAAADVAQAVQAAERKKKEVEDEAEIQRQVAIEEAEKAVRRAKREAEDAAAAAAEEERKKKEEEAEAAKQKETAAVAAEAARKKKEEEDEAEIQRQVAFEEAEKAERRAKREAEEAAAAQKEQEDREAAAAEGERKKKEEEKAERKRKEEEVEAEVQRQIAVEEAEKAARRAKREQEEADAAAAAAQKEQEDRDMVFEELRRIEEEERKKKEEADEAEIQRQVAIEEAEKAARRAKRDAEEAAATGGGEVMEEHAEVPVVEGEDEEAEQRREQEERARIEAEEAAEREARRLRRERAERELAGAGDP